MAAFEYKLKNGKTAKSDEALTPDELQELGGVAESGGAWDAIKQGAAKVRDTATGAVESVFTPFLQAEEKLLTSLGMTPREGQTPEGSAKMAAKIVVPQTPGQLISMGLLGGVGKILQPAVGLLPSIGGAVLRTGAVAAGETAGGLLEGEGLGEAVSGGLNSAKYGALLEMLGLTPQIAETARRHIGIRGPVSKADAARVGAQAQKSVPSVMGGESPLANTGTPTDLLDMAQHRGLKELRGQYDAGEEVIKAGVRAQPGYTQTSSRPDMSQFSKDKYITETTQGINAPTINTYLNREGPLDIDEAFRAVKELGDLSYGKVNLPEHLTSKGYMTRRMYDDAKQELADAIGAKGTAGRDSYDKLNEMYGKGRVAIDAVRGGTADDALKTITPSVKYDITKGQEYAFTEMASMKEKGLGDLIKALNRGQSGGRDEIHDLNPIRFLFGGGAATQTPQIPFRTFSGGNPAPVPGIDPTSGSILDYLLNSAGQVER